MDNVSKLGLDHGAARMQPGSECFILNIAVAMFLEHGYGHTHMADIAHACNMTLNALREKYVDKETLFRLAVDREAEAALVPKPDKVPVFDTAIEAMQFAAKRRKFVFQSTRLADISRIVSLESVRHPEIADVFRTPDGREQTQALAEHALRFWIEQGLFRQCNVPFAVRQFIGMINQAFLFEPRTIGREIDNLDAYLQSCCEWFVREYGAK